MVMGFVTIVGALAANVTIAMVTVAQFALMLVAVQLVTAQWCAKPATVTGNVGIVENEF